VRKLINLDIKKEIISKRESGKSVGHIMFTLIAFIFYYIFFCLNDCV